MNRAGDKTMNTNKRYRYRIHASGFAPIEVPANSLKEALETVHRNVRAAFEYAQVAQAPIPGDRSAWCMSTETSR
jgi:hypothetical protein